MRKKIQKKHTIADVAAAVGVSKTTVSRYLHGDYEFMSEKTRKKIQAVIEELDYRPNRAVQNLNSKKSKKSYCIGITIADIGNPFSSLLMKGVQSECRKRGCQLLVADADNNPAQENKNIESFLMEQVDGLIINSVGNNQDYIRGICQSEKNKPMVLLDRIYHPAFCDSVSNNNRDVTMEMLQELEKQGWKHIVFVSEVTEGISNRAVRKETVETFLSESNTVDGEIMILGEEKTKIMEKLAEIIHVHPGTCIFANNDEVLLILISCLHSMELEIGKDIGICAFANEKWAKYSGPGITCIELHPFQMGEAAAGLLFQRMDKKAAEDIIYCEIKADICIYDSTHLK